MVKKNVADEIQVKNAISEDKPDREDIHPENDGVISSVFRFDDDIEDTQIINPETSKTSSKMMTFLAGLKKTRLTMSDKLSTIFTHKKLSLDMLDALEDVLIGADLGVKTATMLRNTLEKERFDKETDENHIKEFLTREITTLLKPVEQILTVKRGIKPNVFMFVGVNGSGKTTTIGKLAYSFKQAGLKVMLVAGDTFRAAAVEQLTIWGQRNDIPVKSRPQGADAAALVYEAYQEALDTQIDVLLIDTAGRLQNKQNLMQELNKISRILKKYDENLPHETILVLDATTGQNAVSQTEVFRDVAEISGIIITKLDGSAKGGVLVGIGHLIKLPIYAIGVGENISDLQRFNAHDFAKGITGYI